MEESQEPVLGQLRGIGLRLDPESILFAPETTDGLTWGYTIVDKQAKPAMFMADGWREFVPEGVWVQMIESWDNLIKSIKDDKESFAYYLQYDEIKKAVEED